MKKIIIIALIGSLLSFTTCIKDIYSPNACFQEDVLPIFITNCTFSGCHGSKSRESYNLTTYDGIMQGITPKHPLLSEIYTSINGNNPSMPQSPYSKLSSKDVHTIKVWIQMGARNTSNCRSCDTTIFTYNAKIKTIMQTWCVGCHNSGNSGGGYDLSSSGGVISAVANNKLLGSINHQVGYSAMPKNAGQLSSCDIKAIEKWITAGYP